MNKIISIFIFATILFSVNACNQKNSNQSNQTEKLKTTKEYLSVDDVFAQGYYFANKTVHVEGIIEHICKHNWKRFKIVDEEGVHELKIELGDKFSSVDASILGKEARVSGKLIPTYMDEKQVLQWEDKIRKNHKGEEDTEHFKEEIAYVKNIYKQILSGEIPHYAMYSVEAENYELE